MKILFNTVFLSVFALAQVCIAAQPDLSKPLTTSEEVGAIPCEDSPNDKEAAEFEKNWKGKTISFTGQVNRGGGISINEYYVTGCAAVVKQAKPGAILTVTGTLISRNRGGSGGEPVELANCRLGDNKNVAVGKTSVATVSSIPLQFLGNWDVNQQNCKGDTDTAITVKPNETYQLELGCKLKSIKKITDRSITVNMICENESEEKFDHTYTFNLLPNGRLVVGENTLVRCQ
jgi:hypothetical protein